MPSRLLSLAALMVLVGCSSTTTPQSPRVGATGPEGAIEPAVTNETLAVPEYETPVESLDRRYIIGPTAARTIGYRIDWQYTEGGTGIDYLTVQDDSAFVIDEFNVLTRILIDGGDRAWRIPVADPIEHIIGVTLVPERERVYLTTGGAVMELDGATGAQIGKQRLDKIANTEPVLLRPFLVYGSRSGQVIWHSFEIAYQWRGYQVSPSIKIAPRFVGPGLIVVVGNDGRIMVLDASSASQVWSKRLLDNVVASPAVSPSAVYVAGIDQHVWAFDLGTGRNIWRYLSESPLREPPSLVDDRLYQHIPSEGLVCFEALPLNSPGGVVLWKSPDSIGNVITQRGAQLIAWNAGMRRLEVIDAGSGAIVDVVNLPQVHLLQASRPIGGDLFATSDDGRVIRLVPRHVRPGDSSS